MRTGEKNEREKLAGARTTRIPFSLVGEERARERDAFLFSRMPLCFIDHLHSSCPLVGPPTTVDKRVTVDVGKCDR